MTTYPKNAILKIIGTAYTDGNNTIEIYEWSIDSNILNEKSNEIILDLSLYTTGKHTISLRAQNSCGSWSQHKSQDIIIEMELPTTIIPIMYIKFDEINGNIAYDSSINKNNATVYNTTWVTGKINNALKFNGTSSYGNVPHNSSLSSDSQTVMLWFKPLTNPPYNDYKGIIYKAPNTGYNNEFGISLEKDGGITFSIYDDISKTCEISSTTKVISDTWYHITLVKRYNISGDILEGYVNGIKEMSKALTWHGVKNTNPIVIGKLSSKSSSTRYFNGLIDEVKIFNVGLTQSEILFEMDTLISTITINVVDQLNNPLSNVICNIGNVTSTTDSNGIAILNGIHYGTQNIILNK